MGFFRRLILSPLMRLQLLDASIPGNYYLGTFSVPPPWLGNEVML
ncbi:hypothetical protein SynMEDNS5_01551 [Synechococcus sp. MEDNS5]|nr:hypothetical protein SynMEDNS5_01551 [Synechococcus sp. MEDNS5]